VRTSPRRSPWQARGAYQAASRLRLALPLPNVKGAPGEGRPDELGGTLIAATQWQGSQV